MSVLTSPLMTALREPVPLAHMIQLRDVIFEQTGRPTSCSRRVEMARRWKPIGRRRALTGAERRGARQWPMGVSAIDVRIRALARAPATVLESWSQHGGERRP